MIVYHTMKKKTKKDYKYDTPKKHSGKKYENLGKNQIVAIKKTPKNIGD